MKINLRKKFFIILAFLFVVLSALGIELLVPSSTVKVNSLSKSNVLTTEIFQPSRVDVSAHSRSSGVDKHGLKLSFNSEGDSIKLKENVIGDFSIEYVQANESDFNPIKELQFVFTDIENGNNFSIFVEQDNLSYNVGVLFNGGKSGIHRLDNKEKGFTYLYNNDGLYTNLLGHKAVVDYVADTKCVYFGNGVERLLVWDLSKVNNDGKDIGYVLNDFNAYSVEIIAKEIESKKGVEVNNDIIIYSINNVSVESFFIDANLTNSIYANIEKYGIVGKEYLIPQGKAHNIVDGISDDYVSVKVNGESVADNKFIPTAEEDYELTYYLGDVSKKYNVSVKGKEPNNTLIFDEPIAEGVEIGQEVYIPQLKVSGGEYISKVITAKVTIIKDLVELNEYKNVESGFKFIFSEIGNYEIKYICDGEEVQSYNFEIAQENNYIYGSNLKSMYSKNSQIDLSDVCAKFGDETVQGEVYVRIPDGRIISNKQFRLFNEGIYTILFNTTYNGRDYTLKKTFEVSNLAQDLFSNSSKELQISYGTSLVTGKSGVKFTANSGGLSFVYDQLIDISKYVNQTEKSVDDFVSISSTAIPLIEMSIDPISAGVSGALDFTIYLEDAEDSDNKIAINIRYNSDEVGSTVKAGATGQELTGMEWRDAGAASQQYYNGAKFIRRTNRFGFFTYHTFDGTTSDNDGTNANDSSICIYYDNVEKQILCKPIEGISEENPTGDPWLVCDLDEELLFGNNLWSGFKSDKVIIKGQVSGLTSTSVDYFIYTVDGIRLDSSKLIYSEAPTITIENFGGDSLKSIIGKSIKVPYASAMDMYNKSIDIYAVKAYFVKGMNLIDVNISNNMLKTEKAGIYIIRYYAKDSYGNVGYKDLVVNSYSFYKDITLTIGDECDKYKNFNVFDTAKILPSKYIHVENAIGETILETKVYNRLPESLDWDELPIIDERFSIDRLGEYKVEFIAMDSLGRIVKNYYTFNVEKPIEYDYVVDSKLPVYEAFISGNTYDIYSINVLEIRSDGTTNKVAADIYVNGEKFNENTYTAEDFTKTIDNYQERNLKLEYKYGDVVIKEYNIPIVPVLVEEKIIILDKYEKIETVFHVENYFNIWGNAEFAVNNSYTLLTLDNQSSVTYSYPISTNNIKLTFDVDGEKSTNSPINTNIDYVLFTFRDSSNASNYLTVKVFVNENNITVAKLNDEIVGLENLTGSLLGTSSSTLSIKYDDDKQSFYDGNSGKLLFAVKENALGETFNGFDGKIYFTISIQSKDAEPASIRLLSFNNAKFVKMNKDVYKPNIVLDGQILGSYGLNAEILIPKAKAEHPFWDIKTLTVSVYDSLTNEYLISVDGIILNNVPANRDYVLKTDKSSAYFVSYRAVDKVNSAQEVNYLFKIKTDNEISLSIDGTIDAYVKVGDTIKIPNYTVNYLEESGENLDYVIMISPTNAYTLLQSGQDFKFAEKGEYILRFYAIDGVYGKYAIKEYRIIC